MDGRLGRLWPWLGGGGVAVLALGPALLPGSLLGLDLAFFPRLPLPAGVWALGPELSRRVPFGILMAWAAPVGGSAAVGKALVAVSLAAAFAGACRLATGAPPLAQVGAGLLYALSPHLLTRVGAGHIGLVLAAGILPFALPTLLAPDSSPRRTFLWCAALAFTGYSGGIFALLIVAVGLAASRGRRAPAVVAVTLAAQLPWLVPGAVILANSPEPATAAEFAPSETGLLGIVRMLAGYGFWRPSSQVGDGAGLGVTLIGAGLAVLAVAGVRQLPSQWRARAAALAVIGLALPLASTAPILRRGFAAVTDTSLGAPLREPQRFVILALAFMAPAAAFGAVRLGGRALHAMPAMAAVVLAVPGLWGIGGRLEPLTLPASWETAGRQVEHRPGTVLALPWHRYLDVGITGGRRVINPLPDLFGGDVVFSSDPELGQARQEAVDPRERHLTPLLDELRGGNLVSGQLAELGIRWVALLHDVDWQPYADSVARDPGLQPLVRSATLDLFLVRPWQGPVTERSSRPVPMRTVVAPLRRLEPSGPATWAQPAAAGWMRGWDRAGATPNGLVRLPAGSGLLWFWPAIPSVLSQVGVLVAVLALLLRTRARRERKPGEGSACP